MGKGPSKGELKAALVESLRKDSEASVRIRAHMKEICEICSAQNVDPETLLFEVNILRTLSEVMLQNKLMSAAGEGGDVSPKEEKRARKRFNMMCDVIETRGQKVYESMGRKHEKMTVPDIEKGSDVPNELQSYVPAKERPSYIQ